MLYYSQKHWLNFKAARKGLSYLKYCYYLLAISYTDVTCFTSILACSSAVIMKISNARKLKKFASIKMEPKKRWVNRNIKNLWVCKRTLKSKSIFGFLWNFKFVNDLIFNTITKIRFESIKKLFRHTRFKNWCANYILLFIQFRDWSLVVKHAQQFHRWYSYRFSDFI